MHTFRKGWKYPFVFFLFLSFIIPMSVKAEAKSSTEQRVLFLSSYGYTWESVPDQLDGITEILKDECYIEVLFMNTKTIDTATSEAQTATQLDTLLSGGESFDAVILGDDAAVDFAMSQRERYFKGTPLIFLGINSNEKAMAIGKDPLITGVLENFNYKSTLEFAKSLYPEAKKVIAISDDSVSGKGSLEQYYQIARFFPELDFTDVDCSDMTKEQIQEKVAEADDDDILLYLMFTSDGTGQKVTLDESVSLLTEVARVPIFKADELGIEYGLLGGRCVSYEDIGQIAGQLTKKVLDGEAPVNLPVVSTPDHYYINQEAAQYYHINMSKVPRDAVIVNPTDNFWRQNRVVLIPALLVVLALLLIIIAILHNQRRQKAFTTELKAKTKALETVVLYDDLTGIYNRRGFYQKAEQLLAEDTEHEYLIMYWNFCNFKVINELFGSETGDAILCEFAEELKTHAEDKMVYGRLQADNFVVIGRCCDVVIEHLINQCSKTYDGVTPSYHYTLQFGLYYITDRRLSINAMCDRAQMVTQKGIPSKLQQSYAVFDESLSDSLVMEQLLVSEMELALSKRQFQVYYQPVYNAVDKTLHGAEALVRWIHPERGIISPGIFIPLFEEHGLITQLDNYVGEIVTAFQFNRMAEGKSLIPISVNQSRANFLRSRFDQTIMETITSCGVPVGCISIEITESAFMDNEEDLILCAARLREAGIRVLMDDFGSGYSSFNTLQRLPVDIIKIDMKFLEGFGATPNSRVVLSSIIEMTKGMGLKVVAEGVEDEEQFEFLRDEGCDYIQGYYFSRPIPTEDFIQLLDDEGI
ncbi:diguanylate cyclase (GGDEF) domain-containing protein [Eubacterium aggregans]|uniref:Diguanylate cyclase (GGDEF) domain-containing protein n=2 Tax=Eubacterium aggregans TaxID=81409 RepID=A0A1H4BSU0_9FIRM|nr:diguanylate cyclase (GGDEF) domain-containing protein [Eubacterium aggregans]